MTEEIRRRGRPPRQPVVDDLIGGGHDAAAIPENPPIPASEPDGNSKPLQNTFIPEKSFRENAVISAPSGWFPMKDAPKDRYIVVSVTGEDQTSVYWRVRRIVDKKNLRYVSHGAWTDHLSRLDIDFEPRYWRPYVASDYIPVPRTQ